MYVWKYVCRYVSLNTYMAMKYLCHCNYICMYVSVYYIWINLYVCMNAIYVCSDPISSRAVSPLAPHSEWDLDTIRTRRNSSSRWPDSHWLLGWSSTKYSEPDLKTNIFVLYSIYLFILYMYINIYIHLITKLKKNKSLYTNC